MNRTIRIALTLLMAVLTTFTVQATDFITEVMLIGHADKTEFNNLLNTYKNQGWKVIDYDLNKGCGTGSAYINLLYKSESNSDGFNHGYITDFYIKTGKNPPGSLTYDGRTYQRVSCKGSSDFVNGYGDLNDGCGSGSEYIYLFYTKGTFSDNRAVTSIYFNDTQSGAVGANGGSTGYDLNKGCGSESPYIYMHFTTGTAVPPMSGSGTTESPYIIGSTADWTKFVTYIGDGLNTDKCYKLTANISVTTMAGTSGQPFKGTFDGGGKTLTVNISGSEQGMAPFHYINGATIRNLTIGGSISSTNKHAAGLVGFCSGGTNTIDGCVVTANVDGGGTNYAGGFVGHGKSSTLTIQNSYYSGNISNFSYLAGGLLGWSDDMTINLSNCLFKGSFSPASGGAYHPIACVSNCDAVTASASKIYYLNTITPTATGNKIIPEAAGVPVSTTRVTGFCDVSVTAADGITYYATRSGTADSPYLIGSAADWERFITMVEDEQYADKYYKLTANISVTTMVGTSGRPFMGAFDGGGKTLTVNLSGSEEGVAPFHYINGATIKDLKVSGSVSSSNKHAAGLVGICSAGTITIDGCAVTANVNGGGSKYAGGIVGHGKSSNLTIQNSYYSGNISNFSNFAGGLLGWSDENSSLTMSNCLFKGSFSPSGSGKYHPFACTYNCEKVTATASKIYYLNTVTPTATGSNIIPEAEGIPVSTTFDIDEWNKPITAVDGITYYGLTLPSVVTIGNGTDTSTASPFNTRYNYSCTQQIYTAEEIGMAGTITSIAFRYNMSFSMEGVQVYLKHTDKSAFADENDVVPISASDKVFEGTYAASEAGWATITLDTPFEYDGNSNLLVCCLDPTDGSPGGDLKSYDHETIEILAIWYSSDKYVPNIENLFWYSDDHTAFKDRNNIQLNIIPNIFAHPSNLLVSSCTEEKASLTWEAPSTEETITGYAYQYKKDSDANWSNEVTLGSTTTSATINGLSANTDYQFRVRTLYGDRYSSYALLRFTTAVELPYECGFEDGMDGWGVWNIYWNHTGIKTDAKHYGEYGYMIDGYSDPQCLISPRLPDTSGITASFYYSGHGVVFQVGYSTTTNDINAFTWGEEIEAKEGLWNLYESNFPKGTKYVAIKNDTSYDLYLDDFSFSSSSNAKPTGLAVSNLTDQSATLTWETPTSNEAITGYTYQYKKNSDAQWSNEVTLGSTITSATINGLSANTDYQFRVRALYGTDVSMYTLLSFTSAVTLPYECGFEDGMDGWEVWNIYWNHTGINTDAKHDGEYGYEIYGYSDSQCLISPRLPGTSGITLSFYYFGWYGNFQVGYSTTTNDISAFTWGEEQEAKERLWIMYEGNYPIGTKYIAVKYNSSNVLYLDDFCFTSSSYSKPTGLAVSNLTDQSATLTWEAPTSNETITGYAYQYKKDSDANWSSEVTLSSTTTSATIDGLSVATDYQFRVRTLYGDRYSSYALLRFTSAVTLPYECGFEDGMDGWGLWNIYWGYTGISSNARRSGENGFMFNSSIDGPQYLISPRLPGTSNITVSFYYRDRKPDSGFWEYFQVGYSTKTNDINDFVWRDRDVHYATNKPWTLCDSYFPQNTKYIAIRYNSTYTSGLYIDDISIDETSSYSKPYGLAASALTDQTATLTWVAPSNSVTGYAFEYKKDSESTWSGEITVTETSVTIGNLAANTTYDFRLKALYFGGNSSNYASMKFTTEGHPETLPYAYGFEDGLSSWRIVDGNLDTGIYSKEATFIHSGDKSFMFFSPEVNGSAQYLISPELANSPDMKVSFWFKCYLSENVQTNASFKVGYSTTTKDLDAFTWEIQEFADNAGWQEYVTYFPAGTKYVAIKRFVGNFLYLDDFSLTESVIPATPTQLTASNLTSTSADLSWMGDAETYLVRYRMAPLFFEDFENGINEWKVVNQGGTANTNWQLEYMEIDKNHYAGAASYDGPTEEFYAVDNWLISPQVNLGGALKYMTAQTIEYPVHYEVLLSTTTDDLSAFTKIAAPEAPNRDEFVEVSLDLSSYQGKKGYVAFRLNEKAENQGANLGIDNVGIYPDNYNTTWKFIETTGKSTTVTGLQPFTSYEFQVQTIVTNYYSPWSEAATFTTNNIIPLADDADNTEAIAAIADDKTHDVMLKGRKFWKDDDWNTLCLPFGVESFTGTPLEGATVKTLVSATFSNGTLTMNFSDDLTSIEAGKPYIVKWPLSTPDYVENPVFNGVTITSTSPTDISGDAANFHGIFNPYSTGGEDNTMLYLGANNTLYYPSANLTINAFRAYFTLNGITAGDASGSLDIKAFVLNFGEETGIDEISKESRSLGTLGGWYLLDGRRLGSKPADAGLYIHNGRKVLIK